MESEAALQQMGWDDWSTDDAVRLIREEIGTFSPDVMFLLGSGLSDAVSSADIFHSIPYSRIPGMAEPTVTGHPGKLQVGSWGGRSILVFQGRNHFYEGHSWERVTMPVQLAARLGVRICILTNASGAINQQLRPGMIVAVDDHINFTGSNPLVGRLGSDPANAFPDLGEAYSLRLRAYLDRAAMMHGIELAHGIYVGVSGPSYETPAEIRALGFLGADLVGMSTVGEVILARQMGLECCAVSCVTNMAAGVTKELICHSEVIERGRSAARQLGVLFETMLRML